MPRRAKPPRLYLRARPGRGSIWVILDSGQEVSTGACETDIRAAEAALEEYLAAKRHPYFGRGHPASILIDDILAEYGEKHAPKTRRPDLIGISIDRLLGFFSGERARRSVAPHVPITCNGVQRNGMHGRNAMAGL